LNIAEITVKYCLVYMHGCGKFR